MISCSIKTCVSAGDQRGSATTMQCVATAFYYLGIRPGTETLGRATENFAARRMDRSIQAALQGVAITDLESDEEQGDGR